MHFYRRQVRSSLTGKEASDFEEEGIWRKNKKKKKKKNNNNNNNNKMKEDK